MRLARELDAVVLVRGHHMNDLHASGAGVRDVSGWPFVEDLMVAADVLVSDYSSIFFDWALTGRPAVVFAPDLEWYRDVERGFYQDWPEGTPWPLTTSTEQLAGALQTAFAQATAWPTIDPDPVERNLAWVRRRIMEALDKGGPLRR